MSETPLKLFNSLTREIETFTPLRNNEARVYTCGPTVYNYPHIGNMRAYVFADVLGRTLSWKGYDLRHIINITDVGHLTDDADSGEDKLEKAAAGSDRTIWDIARHYTDAFKSDVKALNIREPAEWSVATDYIDEMIDFAEGIADKHCYELDSGLYFDISTVEDYGRLARAVTEDGEGRIETVDGKRNPQDFAIWRKTPPGETRQMEWDSPWGKGAPGWHLECSVMGEALLGFPFDIHTGGIDHREIHHPNEIAQNQAHCGCGSLDEAAHSGAKIWMHNNFLVERSGKMSKSSGEFLRLQLLIEKGYHPLAYRMMCLQAHYRSELEFSWEGLQAALTRLKRMVMAVGRVKARHQEVFSSELGKVAISKLPDGGEPYNFLPVKREKSGVLDGSLGRFEESICNDLAIPEALALLDDYLNVGKASPAIGLRFIEDIDLVFGLDLLNLTREDLRIRPKDAQITEEEIEDALARRKEARAEKDFATSDAIRDELTAKGVEVMDGDPLGWEWKLS